MDARQISADLFARAAAVAGASNETTPAAITPEIIAFCDSLKADLPVYLPVQKDRNGMYGFCNIGVLEKIKVDSGVITFGWIIWEYPRAYSMAEFHAVWVSATGELIDITPKPDEETRIVFAGDTSYPAEFDFLKRPNNRRMRTYQATHPPGVAPAEINPPTESGGDPISKLSLRHCEQKCSQWARNGGPRSPASLLRSGARSMGNRLPRPGLIRYLTS
jgi:hypothetical protein